MRPKVGIMKLTLALIALLVSATSITLAQTSTRAERELLKANRAYDEALVRGDARLSTGCIQMSWFIRASMVNCVAKRSS
jgi:hypothetical protein